MLFRFLSSTRLSVSYTKILQANKPGPTFHPTKELRASDSLTVYFCFDPEEDLACPSCAPSTPSKSFYILVAPGITGSSLLDTIVATAANSMSCEDPQLSCKICNSVVGRGWLSEDGAEVTALRSLLCRMRRPPRAGCSNFKGREDWIGLLWTQVSSEPQPKLQYRGKARTFANILTLEPFTLFSGAAQSVPSDMDVTGHLRRRKVRNAFFHSNCLRLRRDCLCGDHGYHQEFYLGLQQVESGGLSYCNFISIPGIQHPLLSVDCCIQLRPQIAVLQEVCCHLVKCSLKPPLSFWSLGPCLQLHIWAPHSRINHLYKGFMVLWQLQKVEPPHGAITPWDAHPDF